ncbi:MAG: ATP-binding cassette domain-containing protein [Phycisphaerales bacterium]|nr:ATP-binding cassette domain-containing protein [Phycisphaerales bacterium]
MIELHNVCRVFNIGAGPIRAVDALSLRLEQGAGYVVRGASGSGKSTLLHMLGLMLKPTSGEVVLDGVDPWRGSPSFRASLRRRRIGFVFQSGHLLPWLSLHGNVMVAGADGATADALLEQVGISHRAAHHPGQVSGGERQRAAVARALAGSPDVLLADEPTGTLDDTAAEGVLGLLEQARAAGTLVVLATHGKAEPGPNWRTIELEEGRIVGGSEDPVCS